jgi:Replication-relaxation
LARRVGNQGALLRSDLGFGSAEGWTTVWTLTAEGFEVGSQQMGLKLERVPKQDVGQAFLKHEVMANEVFLGLVPLDGRTWAKVPRNFRWVLGEYLDLPFEEYTGRQQPALEKRRLQPDAILEIPASQRRFFIEYETGSATVRDAKKSTSTMAKLDRYGTFFRAPVGNVLAGGPLETAYTRALSDGWPAEVLFVTRSEARRDSITRVIAARERSDKSKFAARALTLEESHRALCRALYGAEQPRGNARHVARTADPPPATTILPTDAPGANRWRGATPARTRLRPRGAARHVREAAAQLAGRPDRRAGHAHTSARSDGYDPCNSQGCS